jgi:hypothetical protein
MPSSISRADSAVSTAKWKLDRAMEKLAVLESGEVKINDVGEAAAQIGKLMRDARRELGRLTWS